MKRSIKYLIIATLAISLLGFSGCAHQNELKQQETKTTNSKQPNQAKPKEEKRAKREKKEKLQFISVDKFTGNFREGFKLYVTVENNTIFNLRLTSAAVHLSHNGRRFGRVAVTSEVKLPRRSRTQLEIPLRATIATNIASISAIQNLLNGVFSGWTIDMEATVATGIGKFSFEEKNVPLETLIKQVDLSKLVSTTALSKFSHLNIHNAKRVVNENLNSAKAFANKNIEQAKEFTDRSVKHVKDFTNKSVEQAKDFTEKNVAYIKGFANQLYNKFK